MRLLPIVGRELRENSRRGGTYWLRVRVAGQAVLIGIAGYVLSIINPAIKMGTALSWGLGGISMLFCLLAGRRSTADCISQEKREGTLGLLFLTDLKGYDVVLGKLVATSVSALYALMAVFPVLAIPLLVGGMTGGEGERMVIALINTFFFSVAVGIFASAISREFRTAMAANFLIWLGLVALPVACGFIYTGGWNRTPDPLTFYSCPIYSFIASSDQCYSGRFPGSWASGPRDFWASIAVTHALAWFLVLAACWTVPRAWEDQPRKAPSRRKWRWRDVWEWISFGNPAGRVKYRKTAMDQNAYFWHASRARLKPIHVWIFLMLSVVWWFFCWFVSGPIWLDEVTFAATAVLLNVVFKLWITLEASLRLGEDRRSGAFELLLPTCLTVPDILRGQWLALRRQFLKPLIVVIVVEFAFIALLNWNHKQDVVAIVVELIVLVPDIAALICVTMAAGLCGKSQTQATVAAVVRILILPWVIFGAVTWTTEALQWLTVIPRQPSDGFECGEWIVISLAADLIFGLPAWRSLRYDFRRLATQPPQSVSWRARIGQMAAWLRSRVWRLVPARLRIPALATVVAIVALLIFQRTRPQRVVFPPPVLASMTQINAPLGIFSGGFRSALFVLPDGSLWRWGAVGKTGPGRVAMPEAVGTNHDWAKVATHGIHCVGLRTEGTLWELDIYPAVNFSVRPALPGSNWIDFAAGPMGDGSIALKRDGTIWSWGRYQPTRTSPVTTNVAQIGTATNWSAVTCQNMTYIGLRSDGTLWVWGNVVGSRKPGFLMQTNVDQPLQLCSDTNWISLDKSAQARNSAGELWEVSGSLPNPNAATAAVCRQLSSNWAADHIESAPNGIDCLVRADGTLWSTALEPNQGYYSGRASTALHRLGTQTNWVSVWGLRGTAFGLTADGTVWAWGYDFGRESVRTPLQILQELFSSQAQRATVWMSGNLPPPILEEPRPLLKMQKTPPTLSGAEF